MVAESDLCGLKGDGNEKVVLRQLLGGKVCHSLLQLGNDFGQLFEPLLFSSFDRRREQRFE